VSSDPLELTASLLGDLTADLVFLGGASIHLWLSTPRRRPPAAPTTSTRSATSSADPPTTASASDYAITVSLARYQGFENPRIASSVGIKSRVSPESARRRGGRSRDRQASAAAPVQERPGTWSAKRK
jgi:hypothetical protein